MTEPIRVAALQMVSGPVVDDNLRQAGALIAQAAGAGARLVALPENFALMGNHERDKLAVAEDDGRGPIQSFLAEQSARHRIWLVGGTIPLRGRDVQRACAACLVYGPGGERLGRYDKIHLFDVEVAAQESYRESASLEPGEPTPQVLDTAIGRLGLAVCYDLRFPELFRQLAAQGMELLALPSAFTATTGAAHWQILVRARAVENQCVVLAAAQGGRHANGRETHGETMIVGPWGEILARLDDKGPGVAVAAFDRDRLHQLRRRFPVLAHRRLWAGFRPASATTCEEHMIETATNHLQLARTSILEPAGLTESELERVFGQLMAPGVDSADLFFQVTRHEGWVLEDGIVKEGSRSLDQGVGVRAVSGEKTGFAYSDEIMLPALLEASGAARAISRSGRSLRLQAWQAGSGRALYQPSNPLDSLTSEDKIALLRRLDAEARRLDPRVEQVVVSMSALHDMILVAGSDGRLCADVRPLVRLNVSVIAERDGRRESGASGGGGRFGYDYFLEGDRALVYVREAVRQALLNLEAVDAPAGTIPVVLGPGWPGVLLHEAIGHGLEGDFNRKGTSAFAGRVGERVASPLCTIVDDGTLDRRRGSLNIDDEGTPTQCTTLIEKGVLKGYMQDTLNARLTGVASTGNGRRESYAHLPMPRMTNTYMLAGPHDPQEIVRSVKKGLYAVNFGGGQVDITSGKFVFSASEAYLIEDGKVTRPVKGATLIGSGPEVLTRVSMVGNDLQLDAGVGTCGKDGQSVPVGVGQPTLKIDAMTVGGTAA